MLELFETPPPATEKKSTKPPFQFADHDWRRFPQSKHEELGLTGNDLWCNRGWRSGALLCSASSRSDKIAVSKTGLDYLAAAVERGDKITSGEVVLYEWRDDCKRNIIILQMDIGDVVDKVKNITPRDGKYGPFWLFYRDGTPEDGDVPF
jgi:hypothetical protein